MKIFEIEDDLALNYCTRDEDHFFDRKAVAIKGDKIQKIAVAFANADGGEIVIGIADVGDEENPMRRWQGRDSIEEFNGILQAISEPSPSIEFRFDFLKRKGEHGNYVLRVKINKSLEVHETTDKTVYIRKNAQSLPLKGAVKIMELAHAKGIRSAEDSFVPDASIDELEKSSALKELIEQLPGANVDPLDFLLKQNLMDKESFEPRRAAVLLFADNPSEILSQCAIKVARYDTKDEDLDRDALGDVKTIEGPLYRQIRDAYEAIAGMLKDLQIWTLDGLAKIRYPRETIWEILVNTVIHRDYSISDHIHINVFNNRIEFKSPGRLPGFVTLENILDNRFSRNSKIVRQLARYKDSPNKDLGEGINTAFQRMNDFGLPKPEIGEEGNYVVVTLRHSTLLDHEKVIQEFVEKYRTINNRQARDLTGLSAERTSTLFARLRDRGVIKRIEGTTGTNVQWSRG